MNLHLGPIAIQLTQVLALFCVLVAVAIGARVGRKQGLGISEVLVDMVLVAVPVGRLVFVGRWFSAFQETPWAIFDIRDGGIDLWAAGGAALIMAGWRTRQRPALLRPLFIGTLAGVCVWIGVMFSGVGQPATAQVPALHLIGFDGSPVQLAAPKDGRAMVVNLWATWCPPCQREMPALARAQALHPEIQFVFVNEGETLDVVQRYVKYIPFHLENILVDEGNLLGKALDSSALPMTLIYGTDGRLAYSHQGLISEAVLAMQLERCFCGAKHQGPL